jgi:DNA repair protein RecO (recombination protein O)
VAGRQTKATLIRFELQMLHQLGHLPSFDRCVDCGTALPLETRKRIPFGHLDGGVLCGKCRKGHTQVASVTTESLAAMRQAVSSESPDRFHEMLNEKHAGEIRGLLNHYFSHLIGTKPRAQAFLET